MPTSDPGHGIARRARALRGRASASLFGHADSTVGQIMNFRKVMLVLALSAMAASAQAAGGGASTVGTGAGSAGTSTGGTGQSTGTTTGGLAEQPGTGQRSAPNTNTQTTGQSITGLPPSNPTEAQAQRNRGAGTAPNGQPIGSSGSGLGSPEQPIKSFKSGRR